MAVIAACEEQLAPRSLQICELYSQGQEDAEAPVALDPVLVTFSKKLVRDEFPAMRDDAWQTCAHSSSARFRLSAVLVEGRHPRRV